jgi:hypothetical protein
MATSLIIEDDRGTFTGRERRHNGYYGGDFSSLPVLSPRDLLARFGTSTKENLA